MPRGAVGPYQLQAAIAAVHDEAANAAKTDWAQILAPYTVLLRMAEGLRLVAELEERDSLRGHHRLYAVRGHLEEMAGHWRAA